MQQNTKSKFLLIFLILGFVLSRLTQDVMARTPISAADINDLRAANATITVDTLSALQVYDRGDLVKTVYVKGRTADDDGYQGIFLWNSADHSAATGSGHVDLDIQHGIYVAPSWDATGANGAWVRVGHHPAKPQWFGSINGTAADLTAIQAALNLQDDVLFEEGIYGIGDSGDSIDYRGKVACNVGLALNTGQKILTHGKVVFKVMEKNTIALSVDNKSDITIEDIWVEGNSTVLGNDAVGTFGVYFLGCSDIRIDHINVNDVYSNAVEIISCSNVIIGSGYVYTDRVVGPRYGGAFQFEDCTNVNCGPLSGHSVDDFVSVISYNDDIKDMSFTSVNATSERARAFFIGLAKKATAQYHISNIYANVISRESDTSWKAPACMLFRGAIYENIYIKLIDYGSYISFRCHPYGTSYKGGVYNCTFDVTSYDALNMAIDIRQSKDSGNKYEHNKLIAKVINPNVADVDVQCGVAVEAGIGWNIQADINYQPGKKHSGSALVLGGFDKEKSIKMSKISGIIDGGNLNIDVVRADGLLLDGLVCQNTENGNRTSINIQKTNSRVAIGAVQTNGEIYDQTGTVEVASSILYRDATAIDTGSAITEVDLMSCVIPAHFMNKYGLLHIKASGVISGTAGHKTVTFYWGATPHTIHTAANDSGNWSVDIIVAEQDSRTLQRLEIIGIYGSSLLVNTQATDSEDAQKDIKIKFTGQTTDRADTVSQQTMVVIGG